MILTAARRVPLRRPRVRRVGEREAEMALESYETFASSDLIAEGIVARMLAGISTRRYPVTLGLAVATARLAAMTVELFLAVARVAAELLAGDDVRAHWQQPSALEGYTISGLAGHLARAVLTVERYLSAPEPPADREATNAAGYLVTVLGGHHPVDSEFHAIVRARGAEAAAAGPEALASELRASIGHVAERLAVIDVARRRVEVLSGVTLTVEEYLETRLVELVVHLDDLAVSLGRDGVDLPQEALQVVAGVLGQVAAARAGGLATVRSLARAERHPDAVRAV